MGVAKLRRLAGMTPSFQRARERGRRAAAIRLHCRQPSGARGGVLCRPRVLSHRERAFWSHPARYIGEAPLRDGLPRKLLPDLCSLRSPAPAL